MRKGNSEVDIFQKVSHLMSNYGCGVLPVDEISKEKMIAEIGFDSLRYMELVLLLEESFEIHIPDELLDPSPNTTVADIAYAVESCVLLKDKYHNPPL